MTKHLFGAFSEPLRRTVSDRAFESPFGEGSPISFRATRGSDKNSRFAFVRPPPPASGERVFAVASHPCRTTLPLPLPPRPSAHACREALGCACPCLLDGFFRPSRTQRILPRFKALLGVCRPSGSRTCPIGPSAPSEHAQNRFWRVCVGYVSPLAVRLWPARPCRRLPRQSDPSRLVSLDHRAPKGFCRVLRPY